MARSELRRALPRSPSSRLRLQIEADDAGLSHLRARELNTLAPDAARFRPAERHHIETVIGRIVDDDAADRETLDGGERVGETRGEDRGVEPVVDRVGTIDRFVERRDAREDDNRAIQLVAIAAGGAGRGA